MYWAIEYIRCQQGLRRASRECTDRASADWIGATKMDRVDFLVILVFIAAVLLVISKDEGPKPTDRQRQVIRDRGVTDQSFFARGCAEKEVCPEYGSAMKSCAAAANLDRCIDIKLDWKDHSGCGLGGTVIDIPEDAIPTSLQCFLARIGNVRSDSNRN